MILDLPHVIRAPGYECPHMASQVSLLVSGLLLRKVGLGDGSRLDTDLDIDVDTDVDTDIKLGADQGHHHRACTVI